MAKTTKGKNVTQPAATNDLFVSGVPIENPRGIYGLYVNEFSNLKSQDIKSHFEAKRKGLNFFAALMFDDMLRKDLQIGGVWQTRKLAIAPKEYEIAGDDEAMNEFARDILKNFDLVNFETDVIESGLRGNGVFEKVYEYKNGKILPKEVSLIPHYLYLFDDRAGIFKFIDISKADAMTLRTIGNMTFGDRVDLSQIPQVEVPEEKLLHVKSLDGNAPNGLLNGCEIALTWAGFFKNYGEKDFAQFVEKFANDVVIITYDKLQTQKGDVAKFENVARDFGKLFYAVLPNSATFTLKGSESKGQSKDVFDSYLGRWDNKIAIRVLGQTLTTEIKDKGSFSAAKVHDTVRQDILFSDMLLVKQAVNELIRSTIDLNFANVKEYPVFRFKEEINLEAVKTWTEIMKGLNEIGFAVSLEDAKRVSKMELTEKPKPESADNQSVPANYSDSEFDKSFNEYWERMAA